jgi:transposase, IS30 family
MDRSDGKSPPRLNALVPPRFPGSCKALFNAARIDHRPEVIESRPGDFKGDTVLGPSGTGGIVTPVDRKSRYTIVTTISSKEADHVHGRIELRLKELHESLRRSTTLDNGTECARCDRVKKQLDMELHYAGPGCPYQPGTNEYTNSLRRQHSSKGIDF